MACIIVFDDDPDSANLLRRLLERAGHAVLVISEPEQAIRVVASCVADLVILRVKGANRKSEQVYRRLKGIRCRPRIMTISCRVPLSSDDLADEHYLVEPVDLDTIERKVQQLLEI